MKKKIVIITLILIFLFPLKAYASTTSVEVNVDGNIKKGEEINILINMKGLESLYAASVNFTYDKSILNIVDISAGDYIKKYADEIMEMGGEVDTSNNKTSYSFTFLGDKEGINGDGTLAIIKAEVLKDGNLSIGEDSINIKLVKRAGDSVENYNYKFIGYSTEKDVSSESKEENDTNNKDESNNITDENVLIPNNENNTENNTNKEDTLENIEDAEDEDNNKEENTFWGNILNGNIVENIINNIKNFISGNNNIDILNEEDVNKDYNFDENNNSNNSTKEINDGKNNINNDISINNNLENNEDEKQNKGESKSSGEVSKYNLSSLFYILIGGILGVIYYYKFIKSKTKNN
ncbi:cohesin domain-containing protein [Clostridium nigeriense]|uniref:cohesin domain-containing protein n=1 Tax=Clostridium nigeriense TaxID=1805470 RepID=UPI003D345CFB